MKETWLKGLCGFRHRLKNLPAAASSKVTCALSFVTKASGHVGVFVTENIARIVFGIDQTALRPR
jgi:hypothetical protein